MRRIHRSSGFARARVRARARRVAAVVAVALGSALVLAALQTPAVAATAPGEYRWPVVGPVIAAFDPPETPYGSGHRGIDIAAAPGTVVVAPAEGVVRFAGPVGGSLFVTLDHGGGIETTYSWLTSLLVRRGDAVNIGDPIATTGIGHAAAAIPHLHLGAKIDGQYVDPLSLLGPLPLWELIRLAPLAAPVV